ncbi:MAG: YncE family protein [Bacteroidia bacterium]|nr:YncE family protein [Bacteroidia bacterium]
MRKLFYITICLIWFQTSCREQLPDITESAVYVANEVEGSVSVFNASTYELIRVIDLTDRAVITGNDKRYMPHNVQVAPDGKTVWVTGVAMEEAAFEDQVIVIDAVKNKIKERINVGLDQHIAHVVLDAHSEFAYVTANEPNEIIQINAKDFKVVKRFSLGHGHYPHGLRCFNNRLYVANIRAHSMSVIDITTGNIVEIPLGGVAVQTAVSPDGLYAYASLYDTKEVARVDLQTYAITKLPLPANAQGPIQLYPTPDSRKMFVCDQGGLEGRPLSDLTYVIDLDLFVISDTIRTGSKTHGVVVSNTGQHAFVTGTADNTLSVIEVATGTVVRTLNTGTAPNGVSYWFRKNSGYGGQP